MSVSWCYQMKSGKTQYVGQCRSFYALCGLKNGGNTPDVSPVVLQWNPDFLLNWLTLSRRLCCCRLAYYPPQILLSSCHLLFSWGQNFFSFCWFPVNPKVLFCKACLLLLFCLVCMTVFYIVIICILYVLVNSNSYGLAWMCGQHEIRFC